jgi:hypothetical protein
VEGEIIDIGFGQVAARKHPMREFVLSKIERRIKAAVEMRAREECSGPRPGAVTRRAAWLVNAALVLGPIGYYAPRHGKALVQASIPARAGERMNGLVSVYPLRRLA